MPWRVWLVASAPGTVREPAHGATQASSRDGFGDRAEKGRLLSAGGKPADDLPQEQGRNGRREGRGHLGDGSGHERRDEQVARAEPIDEQSRRQRQHGGGEGGDREKRTHLEACRPQVVRIKGHSHAARRDGREDGTRRHVQEHHAAGLRHGAYHTGDMVRDRVGDWRLAWRFALAGVIAGLLVISLAQTGVTNGTFDRGQDQLFPAAAPDPRITYVEVDSRTQRDLGAYPFNNGYHAQVINYLAKA